MIEEDENIDINDLTIKSGIYWITNLITDQIYVGSAVDLNRRKSRHFNQLKNNKHSNKYLQNSFNKYGENNFKFEVIEKVKLSFLYWHEQDHLDNLWDGQNKCFNIVKDVEKPPNYNDFSEEKKKLIREKMSKSLKGLKKTPEHIEKVRQGSMKPVVQMSLDGQEIQIFRSARDADAATGVSYKHISCVCHGKYGRNTVGGFKWKFKS